MSARRRITPGARARRNLAIDLVLAAALAVIILQLAAGLGVVGFFALLVLIVGVLWVGLEKALVGVGRRNRSS